MTNQVAIPKKGFVSRVPALGFGDIVARFVSPAMIEVQEKSAPSPDYYLLIDLDEARALRDWLNKADL